MDFAEFTVFNQLTKHNISFQYQYNDCYKCMKDDLTLSFQANRTLKFKWSWIVTWVIYLIEFDKSSKICNYNSTKIYPGVKYEYIIQKRIMKNELFGNGSKTECFLIPDTKKQFDYLLPFYSLVAVLCVCATLYYAVMMLYRHRIFQKLGSKIFLYKIDLIEDFGRPGMVSNIETDDEYISSTNMTAKALTERRLRGLDTFRGLSVVLMIFVNYGGGGYWYFNHSIWNGITVADFVFPWFVFVMGVTSSICVFRSSSHRDKKFFWLKTWLKGCKRSIVLFIIGIILESRECKGNIVNLRIMGPLQRLAGAYLCLITVICIVSKVRIRYGTNASVTDEHEYLVTSNDINSSVTVSPCSKFLHLFNDICTSSPYIVISIVLLVSHACISLLVRVPGCDVGYMGPGGIGDNGTQRNCTGGVAGYIDRLILHSSHMYQTPTIKELYRTSQPFDPEGILGYLSCTALCFLGYWAGNVMVLKNNWSGAVKRLLIYALISVAIGIGLCQCKSNGGFIPINKNLWSVSFVMVTAASSFFLLAFMFLTVDVLKLWNGSPFKYAGMNPIVIYCGHILLENSFPVHWKVQPTYTWKLIMDTWGVVFWSIVAYVMYLKKVFITV